MTEKEKDAFIVQLRSEVSQNLAKLEKAIEANRKR